MKNTKKREENEKTNSKIKRKKEQETIFKIKDEINEFNLQN